MLAAFTTTIAAGVGVTIAAHRFFTHRSFQATFKLRCFLAALFILAGEVSALRMLGWVLVLVQISCFKLVYKIFYYSQQSFNFYILRLTY